jgi:hypothetical protein
MSSTLLIMQAYKNGKLKIIMITNCVLNFIVNQMKNKMNGSISPKIISYFFKCWKRRLKLFLLPFKRIKMNDLVPCYFE